MKKKWWKEAVVYQVYPRSFMDSNGDGIGDLKGVTQKLDYIQQLGIDVIWLCPMYASPNDDNGYDISDYQAIMSEFGTMDDFDELLEAVHARGMKLILDLVVNHTSDEHPWFIESRSSRNNPKRDWYIWRDKPNNWESIFSGSAWEYDEGTQQYFLHLFSTKQPDLNWENGDVRQAVYDMMNWWLDKGIDGFRVDAISHIKKEADLPDMYNPENRPYVPSFGGHLNRPGIHTFLQELKEKTLNNYDVMTVGEANGVSVDHMEDALMWAGEDQGAFNMVFQFEHLGLWQRGPENSLDIWKLRDVFHKWQTALEGKGWNALFLENHDQPRSISTWGNDTIHWLASAKSLGMLYFFMKGTPFIYQGQELGMTNIRFDSIDEFNDVAIKNAYRLMKEEGKQDHEILPIFWKNGRDNSRTPMQWDDSQHAGFSTAKPWLKVNPNYLTINAKEQLKNPHSVYSFYQTMIALRKNSDTLKYGTFSLSFHDHPHIFGYKRELNGEVYEVIINVTDQYIPVHMDMDPKNVVLSNYQHNEVTFKPYEARLYKH